MNYLEKRKQLEHQLKSLEDFLHECPDESLERLGNELFRLRTRIKDIKKFSFIELMVEIEESEIVIESKMIFI